MRALQRLTLPWLYGIFGDLAYRPEYRGARLVEEALEMAQAVGLSRDSCHELVDYVYEKEPGDPLQEMGGVLLTALALAERLGYDVEDAATMEFARCLRMDDAAKAKMRDKPRPRARLA